MHRRTFLASVGLALAAGVAAGKEIFETPTPDNPPGTPLIRSAYWGASAGTEPYPDCRAHYALERAVGSPLSTMSWFVNFSADFPRAAAETKAKGYGLLIAWMPILNGGAAVPFADILAGKHDRYLTRFLTAAQAYGRPVTIRFCHEMNLGKFVWSAGNGGPRSPDEFKAAWRYLYRLMNTAAPSPLVRLLWCISTADGPIPAETYFPGPDYIDQVGFDAYSGFATTGWTEPDALLRPTYRRLAALAPHADIWLCEVGCRQSTARDQAKGHDKARWITDLFAATAYPQLANVLFFNKNKEQDWRLESSPAALQAATQGLQSRLIGH